MQENQITIIKSGKKGNPRNRMLIVTPTLGVVRIEWSIHRYGQATPCNWSASSATLGIGNYVPMHYLVADAQNLGCAEVVNKNFEWFLLWEDDVIPPLDAFLKLNRYISDPKIPVVSGLYFTKGTYSEPILYRGLGNSCYKNFKVGDKVWADGVPTGFLLIHSSVIKLMYNESEEYTVCGGLKAKKVFETPAQVHFHPDTQSYSSSQGTSDLNWCHRVIRENVLHRAGWPKIGKKKYPFLCDTNIFCKHIDLSTGKQYP
jgi:hypothetical protein